MVINNTTDIPMAMVQVAIRHALDHLPDKGAGIELAEVIIKNKAEGKVFGQFGWYFPKQKRIVVIVPRTIAAGFTMRLRRAYQKIHVRSRVDFLITTMAHEMRHAYQHQVSHYMLDYLDRTQKWFAERDAEAYQALALMEWHEFLEKSGVEVSKEIPKIASRSR